MTLKTMLAGLALLGVAVTSSTALADDASHFSQVRFLLNEGSAGAQGDIDGTWGIIAEVGQPIRFHIDYLIGWYYSGQGTFSLKSSDINDPEYALLWDEPTQNPSNYPPGLTLDSISGVFSGTPTQAGLWKYQPAVRDKKDGESPYGGDGFWFTDTAKWNNKTWIEAKDATPVVVLPPVSKKALMLECTGTPAVTLLLQVDYESGIVRIIGNDGKIAGVYHANVTDDFIAWGKTNIAKPPFGATSVKLDRKTGAFTTTVDIGNAVTGNCQKRTAEQKF